MPGVPVEIGRLVRRFPVGVGGLAQEVLGEVGRSTQKIPEELSQSCQEFSVAIGRLAQRLLQSICCLKGHT